MNNIVTYEDVQNDSSLIALKQTAIDQGVFADFFFYKQNSPSDKDSSMYFVVCPDIQGLLDLKAHPNDFTNILEKKEQIGRHSINPYYEFIRLDNYYSDNNYFKKYMDMCRAIEDVSITRNAFYEFGYTLPTEMSKRTILEMYDMDQRRRSTKIPETVRKRYEKAYKSYIADINQRYKKLSLNHELTRKIVRQSVSCDYFTQNRVEAVHDAMNSHFREYFENRVKSFPSFIYYIEKKPSLNLKDISHLFKGPEDENIWKDDKELKEYNVMFPKANEDIYYGILLEYNCREYKGQSSELYKVGQGNEIKTISVDMEDMWNWNSLCSSNNVPYYINKGELSPLCAEATREIKIAYNQKDEEIVRSICSRLANSRKNLRCVSDEQAIIAEQNRPQEYKNPFVRNQLEMEH